MGAAIRVGLFVVDDVARGQVRVVGAVARPVAWLSASVAIAFGGVVGVGLVLEDEVHHFRSGDWQVVRSLSRRGRVTCRGEVPVSGCRWGSSVSGVTSRRPFFSIK